MSCGFPQTHLEKSVQCHSVISHKFTSHFAQTLLISWPTFLKLSAEWKTPVTFSVGFSFPNWSCSFSFFPCPLRPSLFFLSLPPPDLPPPPFILLRVEKHQMQRREPPPPPTLLQIDPALKHNSPLRFTTVWGRRVRAGSDGVNVLERDLATSCSGWVLRDQVGCQELVFMLRCVFSWRTHSQSLCMLTHWLLIICRRETFKSLIFARDLHEFVLQYIIIQLCLL